MGKILAICTSPRRGTLKTPVPSAVLTPEWGIVGDAHGGSWHRQVSLLSAEKIEAFRQKLWVDYGAFGDGPAVYYTAPGWKGSIGFITAVHGKFCVSCNRVRLTSLGFLRPCLASEAGCDLRALLRGSADDAQLLAAIRETIWAKPREHHFESRSVPATRGMYRIGG